MTITVYGDDERAMWAEVNADAREDAQRRDDMWKGIVHDFLVTMIDMALDDDADSRERRRKDAYSRMEAALATATTDEDGQS